MSAMRHEGHLVTELVNVGDVVAEKYRIDRVLGVGGMGMVVAATHLELDRIVALKFMLPRADVAPDYSARFMREARAAANLRSEHICRVYDVGKLQTGAPYIVMELMEGEDLDAMIARRGPLPVPEAVALILQALEGLAEAHANGIVHRDLKPANLFVARGRNASIVKLLDFGIAKSMTIGGATKTGDMMGSPLYMAPEQLRSAKDVDGRADLWAIGAILYEATTGKLPFHADSLPALCVQILEDEPAPIDDPAIPRSFMNVVMQCLAKDRARRPASAEELMGLLAPFRGGDPTVATHAAGVLIRIPLDTQPPQAPTAVSAQRTQPVLSDGIEESFALPPRTKRWLIIGVAAIAILAFVLVTALSRKHSAAEPARATTRADDAGSLVLPVDAAIPATAPPVIVDGGGGPAPDAASRPIEKVPTRRDRPTTPSHKGSSAAGDNTLQVDENGIPLER